MLEYDLILKKGEMEMLKNIPLIVGQTLFYFALSAFGAQVAFEETDSTEEKEKVRQNKVKLFKESLTDFLNEAVESGNYPRWLASLLIGMLNVGDGIPTFFVKIANYRGWFNNGGLGNE